MYEAYWQLVEKPFENVLDTRFAYLSEQYREALARLLYAIRESKPGGILTGEYGCGKSLIRALLLEKAASLTGVRIVLVTHPNLPPEEFLAQVLAGILPPGMAPPVNLTRYLLLAELRQRLIEISESGGRTVLVVDEGQAIHDPETFEELRLLLNLGDDTCRVLLTLILIAQQSVLARLPTHSPLYQRLPVRWALSPLTDVQTAEYIRHRLQVAGGRADLFTTEAIREVHQHTHGIPRNINNLCDLALLTGYLNGAAVIGDQIVRDSVEELEISSAHDGTTA